MPSTGRTCRTGALLVALAVLAGCGGSDGAPSASTTARSPIDAAQAEFAARLRALAGTWEGTWQSDAATPFQGTLRLTWQQFGRTLRGTMTVSGGQCLDGGTVLGRLDGSSIIIDFETTQQEVIYRGTVTGTAMAGTYTTSCATGGGSWRAERT